MLKWLPVSLMVLEIGLLMDHQSNFIKKYAVIAAISAEKKVPAVLKLSTYDVQYCQ